MPKVRAAAEVFAAFLALGCTSFGGPIAHLGYFREAFVQRRRWLTEAEYTELVTVAQILPGPTSSQVGLAIGRHRAGLAGAAAAWLGFTLPAGLVMILAAVFAASLTGEVMRTLATALGVAALGVIAHAVLGMARPLLRSWLPVGVAIGAAVLVVLLPSTLAPVLAIVAAGILGAMLPAATRRRDDDAGQNTASSGSPSAPGRARPAAWLAIALVALGLVALPIAHALTPDRAVAVADGAARAGALVVGGGHTLLPLLEAEMVHGGLVAGADLTAGYGLVQVMPGPLFTLAGYAGAAAGVDGPSPWLGVLGLVAVFLPGMLLMLGVLPYWQRLRSVARLRAAIDLASAAAVGVLAAAFLHLVISSAEATADSGPLVQGLLILVALGVGIALQRRVPAWLAVPAGTFAAIAVLWWL